MDAEKRIDFALKWLQNSEIRCFNEASAEGGYKNGYDWKNKQYPFVYSEITGYAISTFINIYRWTDKQYYLDLANQSARFLFDIQGLATSENVRGGIPHGLSLPDYKLNRQYYSFDSAMCLQGLVDLYTLDPSPDLLRSVRSLGDWLIHLMQQDNGSFLAMYDEVTDEIHHTSEDFFSDHGCLHAKHAIGLLKLWKVSGEKQYLDAANRVCDWVLGLQYEDGSFRATDWQEQVVNHPHCYATEGLLYSYHVTGSEDYLNAARRSGEWLLKIQNRDGSISIAYKRRWWRMGRRVTELVFPRRVTDATSQSVRIWLMLYYLYKDPRFLEAGKRAIQFLYKMQCLSSSDKNAIGGFYYWPGHPMMFTWCTMFATHAIYAYNSVKRENGLVSLMDELF